MLLEIMITILLGILFGIVTGLTPGIHVNLVSAILVSVAGFLYQYINPIAMACFIISMSTTHTFLDSVPSIFLGAPESATALSVLPGHRYLLIGEGFSAVKLTILGSYAGLLLSLLLFPIFVFILIKLYPLIETSIPFILLVIVILMILSDRRPLFALIVFFLSGILGTIVFDASFIKEPLFPMLSGLFGISTLIISLLDNDCIPKQNIRDKLLLKEGIAIKSIFAGLFGGFVTAVMPGLSSAIAIIAASTFIRGLGDYGFLITTGAVSTVNFSFSLVALHVLDRARNGSIIAIQRLIENITLKEITIFILTALVAGSIACIITLKISKIFSIIISKINYKKLVKIIIFFIIVITPIISGWYGLILLFTSTCIGLLTPKLNIRRIHSMGCIILPVILYFL